MATKTKAELLEEIKTKNEEIQTLNDKIKKLERFKQYEVMTDEVAVLRDSFVNSGFTKEEAFELVKNIISNALSSMLTQSKPVYRSYTR
jgi:vacuolar-type H+-ATPase subunit I/STV1